MILAMWLCRQAATYCNLCNQQISPLYSLPTSIVLIRYRLCRFIAGTCWNRRLSRYRMRGFHTTYEKYEAIIMKYHCRSKHKARFYFRPYRLHWLSWTAIAKRAATNKKSVNLPQAQVNTGDNHVTTSHRRNLTHEHIDMNGLDKIAVVYNTGNAMAWECTTTFLDSSAV